ncbi:MAG: carbon monoxide dehydrogenase subunit G [Pyrinomonadaceae bacterium]
MRIQGTHHLNAPVERVYQSLIDPEVLQRCIPGCERLEKTGKNEYSATIGAGVGSIKGVFTGIVRLEDMRPPEYYRIVVEAKGTPGFVKGSGDFDLEPDGEGMLIKYTGDLQVGGMIASVGQRLIQGTAKMLASRFFTSLEEEVKSAQGNAAGFAP